MPGMMRTRLPARVRRRMASGWKPCCVSCEGGPGRPEGRAVERRQWQAEARREVEAEK